MLKSSPSQCFGLPNSQVFHQHSFGLIQHTQILCRTFLLRRPALDWMIELPKQDPNSERIEVLTPEQFQNLQQVWESYPDRQLAHLHQFIGWTGSRPSEALKLLWKDVDFGRRNYTKRDTKSGQTLLQPMNEVETPDFICI